MFKWGVRRIFEYFPWTFFLRSAGIPKFVERIGLTFKFLGPLIVIVLCMYSCILQVMSKVILGVVGEDFVGGGDCVCVCVFARMMILSVLFCDDSA